MRSAALVSLCLLSAACVDPTTGTRSLPVIDGEVTLAGEFPATGALVATQQSKRYVSCTGTLVAPDVVLTAAHCVHPGLVGNAVPGFTLELDGNALQAADVTPGASAIYHPQFNPFQGSPPNSVAHEYDVALLFLSASIDDVEPARVIAPAEVALVAANDTVDIVGYGLTVDGGSMSDYGVKNDGEAHIVEVGDFELHVGTSGEPRNCQGDSGGPAFYPTEAGPRILSLVSRGAGNGVSDCSVGGIHTRVDPYLEWIHDNAELGCGSGLNAPCPGDVPPDDEGQPDDGSNGDSDGDTSESPGPASGNQGGCMVAADRGAGLGALVIVLAAFVALRRRRNR